jgi:hypothetical protein
MRDASVSSTKTWPRISAAEPHASVLRWGPADSWLRRSAASRAAGWGGSRGRRPGRGHTRRRCRLRNRSARSGRDEPLDRSPDPVPVTFLDTGAASSDGPPRSVASITRDDPEGSGRSPRAFALSAGPWATRPRQPLQESHQRPPSARLTHAAPGCCHPSHPARSNVSAACQRRGARGFAPTWSPRWTTAPPPSPLNAATAWISMSAEAGSGGRRQTPPASGDRSPAISAKTGPSKPGGDTPTCARASAQRCLEARLPRDPPQGRTETRAPDAPQARRAKSPHARARASRAGLHDALRRGQPATTRHARAALCRCPHGRGSVLKCPGKSIVGVDRLPAPPPAPCATVALDVP